MADLTDNRANCPYCGGSGIIHEAWCPTVIARPPVDTNVRYEYGADDGDPATKHELRELTVAMARFTDAAMGMMTNLTRVTGQIADLVTRLERGTQ